MSDLLPCPFCGKKAMTWSSFSGWHIGCVIPSGIYRVGEMPVQHVLGPFHTDAEAIAAWNTRPAAPVEARGEGDEALPRWRGLDLLNLIQSAVEECRPEKPESLDYYMRLAAALKPAPVSQGAGTVCPECASEDRCGIERGSTHVCHGAKPDEGEL